MATLTNIAEVIAESLNAGAPAARQSLGGGGTAWGWTQDLVPTIANYATPATASGMTFPVTRVSESGTPVVSVAPAAAKPNATTVTSGSETLSKFGGYGLANLEDFLNAANLASAIASVLGKSSLKAFELNAATKLDAGAGGTAVTGADWVSAVASAQARVLGEGGTPSVFMISADDYGAFLADVLGVAAFGSSPESPVGAILGTPIHVSPSAPAGKAYLFDAAAVICATHETSPIVIVDTTSQATSNQIKIVTDLIASTFVVDSSLVVEITAPVGAMSAAKKSK